MTSVAAAVTRLRQLGEPKPGVVGHPTLNALAPELLLLACDMAEELKAITERNPVAAIWARQEDVDRVRSLLARFTDLAATTLGEEPSGTGAAAGGEGARTVPESSPNLAATDCHTEPSE